MATVWKKSPFAHIILGQPSTLNCALLELPLEWEQIALQIMLLSGIVVLDDRENDSAILVLELLLFHNLVEKARNVSRWIPEGAASPCPQNQRIMSIVETHAEYRPHLVLDVHDLFRDDEAIMVQRRSVHARD